MVGGTVDEGGRGGASGARSVGGRRVHCSSAPGRGGSADSAPASGSEDGGVGAVAVVACFVLTRRSVVTGIVLVFAVAAVEDAFFVFRAGELGNKASTSSVLRPFPATLSALISSLNSLICLFCRSHVARSVLSSFAEAAFSFASATRDVPGKPPDANLALTSASRSARSRITSAVALFNLSTSASARILLNRSSLAVRRSNADSLFAAKAVAERPRRPNASAPPHASSSDSYRDFSVISASRNPSRTLSLSSNRRKSSRVVVVAADVDASAPLPRASSSADSSSSFPFPFPFVDAAAFIANLAAIAAAGLVDVALRFFAIPATNEPMTTTTRSILPSSVQRTRQRVRSYVHPYVLTVRVLYSARFRGL